MKQLKKFRKFISLLLGCVFIVSSVAACKDGSGDDSISNSTSSSGNENNYTETMTDIGKIEKTDKVIATNGATSYKILLPEVVSSDLLTASNELRLFLSEATNAEFSVTSDYVEGEKYFSLGNTELSQSANISCAYEEVGLSGYKIKTIGDSICITGYSDMAVVYGVYEYLERMLNFDYYYVDTYSLDKVSTLYLYDFDCIDVPDFDVRVSGLNYVSKEASQITKRRMRLELYQNTFVSPTNVGCWHNSMGVLHPATYYAEHREWYNKQFMWIDQAAGTYDDSMVQLCYNAQGNEESLTLMLNTVADIIFNYFQEYSDKNEFALNMQDNDAECECDACLADEAKYGARSATLIKFFNRLATLIEEKFDAANDVRKDTFKLSFYAYHKYRQAPVKQIVGSNGAVSYEYAPEMKLNQHISPMYANSAIDLTQVADSKTNTEHYITLDKWRQIAPHIHIWLYDVYFRSEGYMVYFNSLNRYQEHLRKFKAAEADWMMFEQNGSTPTAFLALRGYLVTKLMWNIDEDITTLVDKFFDAMYGSQAEEMKKIYVEVKTLIARNTQELGMTTGSTQGRDFTSNAKWWPKTLLSSWYDRMTSAENELMKSGEVLAAKHVRVERISPLYMLIETSRLTYSEKECQNYKTTLRGIFNEFGYVNISQTLSVDAAFASWG